MKSIFLIGLLLACSISNIEATISTGPKFEGMAMDLLIEHIDELKDLDILGEYDGNFFLNLWQFADGFLHAIGYSTVVTSQTECTESSHKFVGAVEAAFGSFLDGKVVEASRQFLIAKKNYNSTVTSCNQTYIEIGRFFQQVGYNWDQAIQTGSGLKRLALHTKQVKTDIANGKAALKNGDYYSAGSNFGSILSLFLYGTNPQTPVLEQAQPELHIQIQSEHKTQDTIASNPFMNNLINTLVNNPQGKNLIEGILNVASSYMGPALNVYDTDTLN